MKFICSKESLLREILIAQEIIATRNALSILSNVLIRAGENGLLIKATDLKVGFETVIPSQILEQGTTTVFCDKFLGILKSCPEGTIELDQTSAEWITIKTEKKKVQFRLKCMGADKFPEITDVNIEKYFSFPQKELLKMISQTIFSISDDETRYFMNGVFFENNEGNLIMVATDGRRLSHISKNDAAIVNDFTGVIVPPKVLNLVRKLASGEGSLHIAISDKNIFFKFNNQKISSILIEGQFPNYRRVIPEKQEFNITVDRNELMDAVKRVSLFVENKSRRIVMAVSDGVIEITSEESDIGDAKEEIACDFQGERAVFTLNYVYLLDPLKVMDCGKVNIQFTETSRAITVYPVPVEDYFHIIMPMQRE